MVWIFDVYNDFVENQGDPRSNKLLFISSPIFTISMVLGYLFFVIYAGPKFMKNRKPFDLRKLVIFYNFLHMSFSAYMVYWCSMLGWFNKYDNIFCVPLDYKDVSPLALDLLDNSWLFFISRFFEFTDTVFFILRKKNNQASVLHLVHHSTVPIITYFGMKFCPIGHSTFAGYINGVVHVIMYAYYMFSAMGPSVQKYLWWKKYLTALQLIQFILVLSHTITVLYIECPGPKFFPYMIIAQATIFFSLFLHFYIRAYMEKTQIRVQARDFYTYSYNQILHTYNKIVQCKTIFEACIPNQEALLDDRDHEKST